jgi:tetratricopeptide (TPR) repeat protein
LKKFDLTYFYDDELKATPNNRSDMSVFVKIEKEVIEKTDIQSLSSKDSSLFLSRLGNLANFLKILRRNEEADQIYGLINELIKRFNLGEKTKFVNKLRWADNYRYLGRFDIAETWFEDCFQEIRNDKSLSRYMDFYLQHLGKVYFDQKKYVNALKLFSRALRIRQKKGDQELISSTVQALKATRSKIKKISVIGNSCSGKTTLSLRMKDLFSVPVHHVDSVQYLPGMLWRDPNETRAVLKDVADTSEWIIDGLGPLKILEDRLQNSDLIVVLRPPLWKLYARLAVRQFKGLFKRRPELPPGCFESTPSHTLKMIKTIWNVHSGLWPQLDRIFKQDIYKDKLFSVFTEEELRNLIISYA